MAAAGASNLRGRAVRTGIAGLALAAAVAALLLLGLGGARSGDDAERAPALPGERLSGPPATLASLLAGAGERAVAVVFWASWCRPCAQEAPALERFYRSATGHGRLVGVDWDDPLSGDARAFVERYRWSFPNLRDAQGAVGGHYGVATLPSTFVIDGRGRIREQLHGPQSVRSLRAALAAVERGRAAAAGG